MSWVAAPRLTHNLWGALGVIGVLAVTMAAPTPARRGADRAMMFRGVRVFDGRDVIARTDVLVQGGRIVKVGPGQAAPPGATIVEGAGKTLLPGFIDAHAHAFGTALEDAIAFGVTTELDMFTDHAFARTVRARQAHLRSATAADLRSAGTLVTAPGGHGTEYGMVIPTLTTPDSAQAFVDARLAEGSDYIKIVYDDGQTYELNLPTLDLPTLKATIAAAHRRGRLAVVHIGSQQGARDAIEAGADGLAHLFVDSAPTPGFAKLVRAHRAFVIPTLSVNESVTGVASGERLIADAHLSPYLPPAARANLRRAFRKREALRPGLARALTTVRQLDSLGVPILAGTDAPNPGTAHGVSIHRELELLVQSGLTPAAALTAATAAPARAFKLTDRGRIARGLRADLVLVDGDPTRDITAARNIAGIWKHGIAVDRDAYRATVALAMAQAEKDAKQTATALGSGAISDFDDRTLASAFGGGWVVSTDQLAGGRSNATLEPIAGGAGGSVGAMQVKGIIAEGLPYAWAGAMFSPAAQPFTPADLSSKKEIVFWARGDGKQYRLMLFSASKGRLPLIRTFEAGTDWKEVAIPFSSFGDVDGHDLLAFVFAGGPAPGEFAFQLDGVRLR